jgi:hypothetical protein
MPLHHVQSDNYFLPASHSYRCANANANAKSMVETAFIVYSNVMILYIKLGEV